ncbi:MAG TPA: cupin domain-containing protein [Flavisolibacter sp.]
MILFCGSSMYCLHNAMHESIFTAHAMAYANKIISNPRTGQQIRFIHTAADTGGALLEMESVFGPQSVEPAAHYHPKQDEIFQVIEGELSVRLNKRVYKLVAGDVLHIAPCTVHSMWNSSDGITKVNWKVFPALDTEYLLETGMGIAADGKAGEAGMPGILQAAILIRHFRDVYRLARPSYTLQLLIVSILSPFARLFGYRPLYPKYLD